MLTHQTEAAAGQELSTGPSRVDMSSTSAPILFQQHVSADMEGTGEGPSRRKQSQVMAMFAWLNKKEAKRKKKHTPLEFAKIDNVVQSFPVSRS